jgi:hypothetical protein
MEKGLKIQLIINMIQITAIRSINQNFFVFNVCRLNVVDSAIVFK